MRTIEIITTLVLFFIMAYLNSIEAAILATSREDLKELELGKSKSNRKKKFFNAIYNRRSQLITPLKLGSLFCSMWISALAVEIFAIPIYQTLSFVKITSAYAVKYLLILTITAIITFIMYIFVEILPRVIAIKHKEKILYKSIDDMYVIYIVFYPVNRFLRGTEDLILKLFKIKKEELIVYDETELVEAIEVATESKVVSQSDYDAMKNLIRLDTLTVENIMVDITEVAKIDIKATKEEIKQVILSSRYSRLPVYSQDERNIVGILNTKRMLENILLKDNKKFKSLVKPVMKVTSGRRLDLLFQDMKKEKEHMAIVVKEDNIAIGIVTMEDILEEVLGDIQDDFEKEE